MKDIVSVGRAQSALGFKRRACFVQQVEMIARELTLHVTWLSDYWLCILESQTGRRCIVAGSYFPINVASAAQLATDKSGAFAALDAAGVEAVPHTLLRPRGPSTSSFADAALEASQLPLVLKPNLESGGVDVFRARSRAELETALAALAQRYRAVALSPLRIIEREIRVVVLNDQVRFAFEKVLSVEESHGEAPWQHNLRLGAKPRLIAPSVAIAKLAQRACAALDLRFATVDIITTSSGAEVLEVNSSVTFELFSRADQRHWQLAQAVYRDVVAQSLTR